MTQNNFSVGFFLGNRRRLQELVATDAPIVVSGSGRMQQAGTEAYPFYQDRNFWYLTGIDQPEVVLVIDGSDEYLILPERSHAQNVFDGEYNADDLAKQAGIATVLDAATGWQRLKTDIRRKKQVATLAANPAYLKSFGVYSNPARAKILGKMKRLVPGLAITDIRPQLMQMRMVKQAPELAAIQAAIDITTDSLANLLQGEQLARHSHEYQLEAELTRAFRRSGAEGHAFTPIVAAGKNACTLHYVHNNSPLKNGQLVVLDVGAQYQHYAADITRTVAFGGQPTARQQAIHAAVAEAVDYAYSQLRPGVLLREYEQRMEQFMGEKLLQLELITTNTHEAVRQYFPHATSHFLGLDTHDAGDYARPLEPGVVLTVEPGIYVAAEGIGVRIEEDILITKTGVQVLSKNLPRSLVY